MGGRRPAAGGGAWVEVEPERLETWLAGFRDRHGELRCAAAPDRVLLTAADGWLAGCEVPFPPLKPDPEAADGGLAAHASRSRTVGVLLVRLGGFAAGIAEGTALTAARVGSRPVHGRSAAGGWSQQRFARRRQAQARIALEAAAGVAAAVLVPEIRRLEAVVAGGDRRAVEEVLRDPRLAPLRRLLTGRVLDVPDPDRRVLQQAVSRLRTVRIRVTAPDA